jgi:hypothetical protein
MRMVTKSMRVSGSFFDPAMALPALQMTSNAVTISNGAILTSPTAVMPMMGAPQREIFITIPQVFFKLATTFTLSFQEIIYPQHATYTFQYPLGPIDYVGILIPWIAFCMDIGVAAQHIIMDLRNRFRIPETFFNIISRFFCNLKNLRVMELVIDSITRVHGLRGWFRILWNIFWHLVPFCHPREACICCNLPQIIINVPSANKRWTMPEPFD